MRVSVSVSLSVSVSAHVSVSVSVSMCMSVCVLPTQLQRLDARVRELTVINQALQDHVASLEPGAAGTAAGAIPASSARIRRRPGSASTTGSGRSSHQGVGCSVGPRVLWIPLLSSCGVSHFLVRVPDQDMERVVLALRKLVEKLQAKNEALEKNGVPPSKHMAVC